MITLIAAMNKHRTIGLKGVMPWHNKEDLNHFKNYTMHKTLIMGRKTYEGLPKVLQGRNILVVSKDESYDIKDLPSFLSQSFDEEIIVAGGGEIYKLAMPFADKLVLSLIHDNDVIGDTFFPEVDMDQFELASKTEFNTFTCFVYRRKDV